MWNGQEQEEQHRKRTKLVRVVALADRQRQRQLRPKKEMMMSNNSCSHSNTPTADSDSSSVFDNADVVARYAAQGNTMRMVPGYLDLLKMVILLLAEHVNNGRVLVVGAGGGLELLAISNRYPSWQLVGVDPSEKMLDLAKERLGPELLTNNRVVLHHGYTDELQESDDASLLFDGATCLLTFHHVNVPDRIRTLQAIQQRLRPGAPFIVAHMSFPQHDQPQRAVWLQRYMNFADITDPDKVSHTLAAVNAKLCILSPDEDEAMLQTAGFRNVELFYTGLAFRGWVAYKKKDDEDDDNDAATAGADVAATKQDED
jgi:tRNA (cmo5U34)-methyltransferase